MIRVRRGRSVLLVEQVELDQQEIKDKKENHQLLKEIKVKKDKMELMLQEQKDKKENHQL